MKFFTIASIAAACFLAPALRAGEEDYILFEDFERFDIGSKPVGFYDRMTVARDSNGSHFGQYVNATPLLSVADTPMLDPGGTDYTYRIKFRFTDPKKIAGPVLTFNDRGKRGETPYICYQFRVERDRLTLAAVCAKNASVKPPEIAPFLSKKTVKTNKWVELTVRVEPERIVVSGDLFGRKETYFDVAVPYGTGAYGGYSQCPLDVKYVIVTANEKRSAGKKSAASGTSDVGPTNAVDQAEKVGK